MRRRWPVSWSFSPIELLVRAKLLLRLRILLAVLFYLKFNFVDGLSDFLLAANFVLKQLLLIFKANSYLIDFLFDLNELLLAGLQLLLSSFLVCGYLVLSLQDFICHLIDFIDLQVIVSFGFVCCCDLISELLNLSVDFLHILD